LLQPYPALLVGILQVLEMKTGLAEVNLIMQPGHAVDQLA